MWIVRYFRVLAHSRYQIVSVLDHLVGVIVKVFVDHQLTDGAFAVVDPVQNGMAW